jgi:MinD-like ATPase involved in chromosome partitioning or flagellar assembly
MSGTPRIITVHSYRGGTGKSTTAANAALLASAAGRRVAIVDTDIQTPGLHRFFGLGRFAACRSLADYLVGKCEIIEAVGSMPADESGGSLWVVPARSRINEINEILTHGYDIGLLQEGFDQLIEELDLDVVFLDTHSGMANETAVAVAVSTLLLVITRADHLTLEARENFVLATRLGDSGTSVVVNMVPEGIAADLVCQRAEQVYQSPVIAALPYCPEVAAFGSDGLFARHHPEHEIVAAYRDMTATILADLPGRDRRLRRAGRRVPLAAQRQRAQDVPHVAAGGRPSRPPAGG